MNKTFWVQNEILTFTDIYWHFLWVLFEQNRWKEMSMVIEGITRVDRRPWLKSNRRKNFWEKSFGFIADERNELFEQK